MKHLVHNYLEREPRFRERRNKDRGIVNLLMRNHPQLREAIESGVLSKEVVTEIVRDHASMDRYWRMLLKENKALRGADYDTKVVVEQRKEIELGYEPRYYQNVAMLNKL